MTTPTTSTTIYRGLPDPTDDVFSGISYWADSLLAASYYAGVHGVVYSARMTDARVTELLDIRLDVFRANEHDIHQRIVATDSVLYHGDRSGRTIHRSYILDPEWSERYLTDVTELEPVENNWSPCFCDDCPTDRIVCIGDNDDIHTHDPDDDFTDCESDYEIVDGWDYVLYWR